MARGDVDGMLTVAGRPKGLGGSPRSAAPVSERQQLALVMQMTGNVQSGSGSPSRSTAGSSSPSYSQSTHGTPTSSRCWRNERGETSLHVAAIRGDLRQVQRLLSQGADPNCTDFAGWTPLHEACNRGWESVAKCLLNAGASVDARGLDDETPLHDAAVNGHVNLVRMLIERGANVNLKNRRGKTACEVAAPGIGALIAQSLDARTSDLNGSGIFERDTNDKSSIGSLHFSCASSYEASGAPCEMRRTPPQNKVDKLSSPRVTLRFHQVKSRDEKKPNSKQEGPTHDSSRVQFTMKMDVGGNKVDDIYEFKSNKDSAPAHGSSTVTDAEKPMASSKLAKEADLRDTGISSDQHSIEGSTRDEKLKSAEAELGKRSHTEANDGEDCDEENRRKKRREERPESGKEMSRSAGSSGRPPGRGMASERCPKGGGMSGKSGGVAAAVSSKVAAGSGGSSGGNTPTDRKSPNASTSPGASPMPARIGAESGESEGEDGRRGEGGAAVGGPKVPPLKIVIPQQSTSGGEGNDQGGRSNGKNGSTRHHHHHSALPYVVSSGGSGDQERTESSSSSSSSSVPSATGGVTSITNQPTSGSAVESGSTSRDSVSSSSSTGSKGDEKKDLATLSEERSQRVLRSSHRMASMHSNIPMPTSSTPSSAASTSPTTAPTSTSSTTPASSTISISAGPPIANPNISPSNPPEPAQDAAPSASTPPAATVGPACPPKVEDKPPQAPPSTSSTIGVSSVATCEEQPQRQSPALPQPAQAAQGQAPSQTAQQNPQQLPPQQQQQQQQQQPVQQQQQQQPQQSSSTSNVDVHPRKRKLKKESADATMDVQTGMVSEVHPHDQPITNCYELFLNIRKQIERRRKGLFPVQPKPPQGFKDYLMNRCTYVLAGNASLSIPNSPPPPSLTAAMKELFQEQEKERYRLRMQHVIEKEKLVLSVEQEILRVHGRAARALANQALPFSACTILKDEEVYNVITPEQEEKDRNARSRYNGRLFLSWLQDVDDKWEKIKESMLLRHHNEAQSLHAVQKMDWEWKLKELGLCEVKNKPVIDEHHVPMVHVSDDFDLLPA